jgi:hypothetical protein
VPNQQQAQLKEETSYDAACSTQSAWLRAKNTVRLNNGGITMQSGRMARTYVSAAVIAALLATNAAAVTLSNVEGTVAVNRGDGFQPASIGTTLSSGDRVRANASGSANIVYENGCSTRVGPSQVAVVLATPPACQGASLKDGGGVGYAPAGLGTDTLLVGGLIVGAGVGIAVAASNDNNSTTYHQVSP